MDTDELKKKYQPLERKQKGAIILNPLQTAGRLTQAAQEALEYYGDGYSICDYCKGTLDKIAHPPVQEFIHKDLALFLGADVARVTHGAREGKFMIMHAITKPGDTILVDRNRHYSTDVAAQRAGLNIVKVPTSDDDRRLVDVEADDKLIREHAPSLVLLTYPDGNVGNLPDARKVGEIAKKHGVPFLINAAYAIGRMPFDLKGLNGDFVVGSGHKSMASAGPIGIIGMTERWADALTRESPTNKGKEIECLGCSVRGVPLVTLMASFPYVVERVTRWDDEVAKARWFSAELEKLGLVQLGEKPHNHDLMMFRTDVFYEISKKHPKKRAFLYEELKRHGIYGLKHGLTKSMKISTYETPHEDLQKVIDVFRELIETYS